MARYDPITTCLSFGRGKISEEADSKKLMIHDAESKKGIHEVCAPNHRVQVEVSLGLAGFTDTERYRTSGKGAAIVAAEKLIWSEF